MKFPIAILASLTALLPLLASALTPLEQIPVKTFEAMKEVERYQIRIAEKHYTDGDFKAALAEYEKFLTLYEKSPGAPYAQLMWSHSMMHLKKPKTALREGFQSVIDYWPESQEATIAAYCMADAYRTMGEVKSAQEAFRFLIREYPDHEIAVRSRTDLLHYARLHQEKEEEMSLLEDLAFKVKRTETSKETCANAARELAEIHFFAQRFDEGKKALATNYSGKELFENVFNLSAKTVGHLLKDEKTKAAAISLADQLLASLQQDIKERPEEGKEILFKAVGLNATLGRPAEIWKIYEEIAQRYGRDDGILGKMAEWCIKRDKREDARRIYGEFKDQVAGLKNIAGMDMEEGKVNEAIETYRKLIEIDGDHSEDHLWSIAGCYEKLSDWKQAIAVYRQVDRFPANNFRMASCHRKLGEQKEAILLYTQCMVADSAAPEASLQTAYTYEEAKEKENAIRTFQLTCRRYPKSEQAGKAHAHLQNKYKINVTLGGAEEE